MHILVVEDHPIYFEGLQSILKGLGPDLQLESASTAEHALKLCENGRAYDLCLVDLRLPGIDGATFVEALRDRNLIVPTVVISAEDDVEQIDRALASGALGYIPKSTPPGKMVTDLQRVLNGDIVLPDNVRESLDRINRRADLAVPAKASKVGITPRQYRVLELMANGLSNGQIAHSMNVSEHTVKSHVRALFQALDVRNRTSCVHIAVRAGLVSPPRVLRDVS
ncbi:MAG: response regulator [Woeseiaceae bacterium]